MDTATSRACYAGVRILLQGSQAVVQPTDTAGGQVETLTIDLADGRTVRSVKASSATGGDVTSSLGLLGVCRLNQGVALVAITEARKVAELGSPSAPAPVYELVSAKVLTAPGAETASKENRQLLELLKDAVDSSGSGRGIYFSHAYDLTNTSQRVAERDADAATASVPLASEARADKRFWYNYRLSQPLLEAGGSRFTPTAILGFVRQLPDLSFATPGKSGPDTNVTLTLIARRGVDRAGTRQWRRGCDSEGNVANFVETEEVLTRANGDLASYVEVRGSIPLLWTQLPNIKYKPTTVIAAPGQSASVFDAHINSLRVAYGDVVAINLVNHSGTGETGFEFGPEGKLEEAMRAEALRYVQQGPSVGPQNLPGSLRYVAFDFHHECSKGRYHRISNLWDRVKEDFERHGFFLRRGATGAIEKRQRGVVRTNCIDCLDRTNVLQGVLGRKGVEMMLNSLGLLPRDATLPTAFPAVEQEFKILWADHGDAVSSQYAGTGAMKSGFTRTGKRTFGGVLDDGYKAVARYYINNFQDGKKQDALDLFSGAYQVVPGAPMPLNAQPSPLVPIVVALMAIMFAAHNAGKAISGDLVSPVALSEVATTAAAASAPAAKAVAQAVLSRVVAPLVLGVGLLTFVWQNGKFLVNKPQLCPHLAVTVQASKGLKLSSKGAPKDHT